MNKLYLTIIIGMLLIVGVIATTTTYDSLNIDSANKIELAKKKIYSPNISECVSQDNEYCKLNLYEHYGINKDIYVIDKYCSEYEQIDTPINCLEMETEDGIDTDNCLEWETNMVDTDNCLTWTLLSDKDIGKNIEKDLKAYFKWLAKIQKERTKDV